MSKIEIIINQSLYIPFWKPYIEGIKPEGRINKMADLQETKFLRLFGLINVYY
jgi:hypothetical protein